MQTQVKLDNDGRILIPVKLRNAIGIKPGDALLIRTTEGGLELEPEKDKCQLCNATANLTKSGDFILCPNCIEKLKTKI